jgi:hypothetical protein
VCRKYALEVRGGDLKSLTKTHYACAPPAHSREVLAAGEELTNTSWAKTKSTALVSEDSLEVKVVKRVKDCYRKLFRLTDLKRVFSNMCRS